MIDIDNAMIIKRNIWAVRWPRAAGDQDIGGLEVNGFVIVLHRDRGWIGKCGGALVNSNFIAPEL
jgi:hypothetical protein